MATLTEVDANEAKALLDSGDAVLVDCREQLEWDNLHIPGAKLVPLSSFDPAQLPDYTGKTLVLQCQSGARSGRLGLWLVQNGYKRVANLKGGIKDWAMAGLPTKQG